MKRRHIVFPAFEIYGGAAGLFDFGHYGTEVKEELEKLWVKHFVREENMLRVTSTDLTPYSVFKASGHVDRFTDLMVRDVITKDAYRADKYLVTFIQELLQTTDIQKTAEKNATTKPGVETMGPPCTAEQKEEMELLLRTADALSIEEMDNTYKKFNIKSPLGNEFSKPVPFNLMFQLHLGPEMKQVDGATTTTSPCSATTTPVNNDCDTSTAGSNSNTSLSTAVGIGYLRPETAQGIFVDFKRLLDMNGGKMPFAAAQVGKGYRNEIAPRNGLLRTREFQMAEIEHFVHPNRKSHQKFANVKDMKLPLYSRDQQMDINGRVITDISLSSAVSSNMIDNETLAYYMGRTYFFLRKCGICKTGIRFRQHLGNEMAHYATDCWDAEVLGAYGWIEIAGHADRSAYDLTHHSKATGVDLLAYEAFETPMKISYLHYSPDRKMMGMRFKSAQAAIHEHIEKMTDKEKAVIKEKLETENSYELALCTGQKFTLTADMLSFTWTEKTVCEESYTPSVIEPSFGVGRVLQCVFDHAFRRRSGEDEQRCYLSLPVVLAPVKCSILPISKNDKFSPILQRVERMLKDMDVSCVVDTGGASIGKRYARTDEVGIPFGVTIDFQSLEDDTVTLRERDSMRQIRLKVFEVPGVVGDLVAERKSWQECLS